MTDTEQKLIAEMMRKQLQLITDLSLLQSLLDGFEMRQRPPRQWRQELYKMRQSPECQAAHQSYEVLIAAFELSGDAKTLAQWLQKISETAPVH